MYDESLDETASRGSDGGNIVLPNLPTQLAAWRLLETSHGGEECCLLSFAAAAVREALEEPIKILTSATWLTEAADLKQAIRAAIAVLK
mgnify:FL=1